eukprot:CFRG1496T1
MKESGHEDDADLGVSSTKGADVSIYCVSSPKKWLRCASATDKATVQLPTCKATTSETLMNCRPLTHKSMQDSISSRTQTDPIIPEHTDVLQASECEQAHEPLTVQHQSVHTTTLVNDKHISDENLSSVVSVTGITEADLQLPYPLYRSPSQIPEVGESRPPEKLDDDLVIFYPVKQPIELVDLSQDDDLVIASSSLPTSMVLSAGVTESTEMSLHTSTCKDGTPGHNVLTPTATTTSKLFPCLYFKGVAGGCPDGDECAYSHAEYIPEWVRPFYENELKKVQALTTTHSGYSYNAVYAAAYQTDESPVISSGKFKTEPEFVPERYSFWKSAPRKYVEDTVYPVNGDGKKIRLDSKAMLLAQKAVGLAPEQLNIQLAAVMPVVEPDPFELPRLQRTDFDKWYAERITNNPKMVLDIDQIRCVRMTVVERKNVFLTGSAGVGKSHTTNAIRDFLKRIYTREAYQDKVIIAAPTGVAATHIDGTTINSATGVGIPKEMSDFNRMHKESMAKLWTQEVELFLIDEISMVAGEFLDALDLQIRTMQMGFGVHSELKLHELPPFGGIQIFVCGDFLQLPPIEGDIPYDTMRLLDQDKLKKNIAYESYINDQGKRDWRTYFLNRGFAFSSSVWGRLDLVTITLRKCYRQEGHQEFIEHLNEIRNGRANETTLRYFNQFRTKLNECKMPTTLYPFNRKVQALNNSKLDALNTLALNFRALDHVSPLNNIFDESGLWEGELFKSGSIVEQNLKLKKDCRVLLIKNLDLKGTADRKPLINGSRGRLIGWSTVPEANIAIAARYEYLKSKLDEFERLLARNDLIRGTRACLTSEYSMCEFESSELTDWIRKHKYKLPTVEFNNGRQMVILPCVFGSEVVGQGLTFRLQIPLKLGWAVSIHKSQGMTLDAGNISTAGAFAEGQSYVALSRVTGPEALYMIDNLTLKDIKMPKQPVIYNRITNELIDVAEMCYQLSNDEKWLCMGPRAFANAVKNFDLVSNDIKQKTVNLVKRLTPWTRTNMEDEVKHWNTIAPKFSKNYPVSGQNIVCYKCKQPGHFASKCSKSGFTPSARYRGF